MRRAGALTVVKGFVRGAHGARCALGRRAASGASAGPGAGSRPPAGPSPKSRAAGAGGPPPLVSAAGVPLASSAGGNGGAAGAEIELGPQNMAQILQSPAPFLMQVGTVPEAANKKISRLRIAAGGRLPLARLDCAKTPQICEALQIRSSPVVLLMARGQVAAALENDLTPQAVTSFVERIAQALGLKVDLAEDVIEQLAEAEEAELFDVAAAEAAFTQIGSAPDLPNDARMRVAAGQARCALRAGGRQEEAEALIDQLDANGYGKAPEVKQAAAMLQLCKSRSTGDAADLDALRASMEMNPSDAAVAEAYAVALFWNGNGRESEAIDIGLAMVRRKRSEETRRIVLLLIEALGPRHPRYASARRAFSSALFV